MQKALKTEEYGRLIKEYLNAHPGVCKYRAAKALGFSPAEIYAWYQEELVEEANKREEEAEKLRSKKHDD